MALMKELFGEASPRPARAPAGERLYAVGDIHGSLMQLQKMVALIEEDAARHPHAKPQIVFLGDYIDRGPNSREVLEFLSRDLPARIPAFFLRGNHEEVMLRFIDGDMRAGEGWLQFGGFETMLSYGVNPLSGITRPTMMSLRNALVANMPAEHLEFLKRTKLYHLRGDYCFVHAGIRPEVAIDRQKTSDFLWIREEFLASEADHGMMIIHGHSISDTPDVRANRIGIDTGAYRTGRLTCLVMHEDQRQILQT